MDYQLIIDNFYPEGSSLRDIFMRHARQVADKALAIAHRCHLDLSDEEITTAAMLHDIGIVLTDAPGIHCHGPEHYLRHGVLGAQLLRAMGVNEKYARVAERHTGAGITADDIRQLALPMPPGDYMPETMLEKLICYADKFYSKSGDMKEKSLERVRASMSKISPATHERFEALHRLFNGE